MTTDLYFHFRQIENADILLTTTTDYVTTTTDFKQLTTTTMTTEFNYTDYN